MCERILEARLQQPEADTLHDPIEDSPEYADRVKAVRATLEKEIKEENARRREADEGDSGLREWPMGTCHVLWGRMKKRLNEEGIVWYSLADLNPGHRFD